MWQKTPNTDPSPCLRVARLRLLASVGLHRLAAHRPRIRQTRSMRRRAAARERQRPQSPSLWKDTVQMQRNCASHQHGCAHAQMTPALQKRDPGYAQRASVKPRRPRADVQRCRGDETSPPPSSAPGLSRWDARMAQPAWAFPPDWTDYVRPWNPPFSSSHVYAHKPDAFIIRNARNARGKSRNPIAQHVINSRHISFRLHHLLNLRAMRLKPGKY